MGFLFRTVFWLAVAMVILPPEARLGGDEAPSLEQLDLDAAAAEARQAAWQIGQAALNTCDTNPELCKAGEALWDTTASTVAGVFTDVEKRWRKAEAEPQKLAAVAPQRSKKIQARVE